MVVLKKIKKFIISFMKSTGNVGDLEVFSTLNKLLSLNFSSTITMVDLKNIDKFILVFFYLSPNCKITNGTSEGVFMAIIAFLSPLSISTTNDF
jgi:hypothetical protein